MVPTPDHSQHLRELMVTTPEEAAAGKKRKATGRRLHFRASKRRALAIISKALEEQERLRKFASKNALSKRIPDDVDEETIQAKAMGEWFKRHPGTYKRRPDHPIHDPTWEPEMSSDDESTDDSSESDASTTHAGEDDEDRSQLSDAESSDSAPPDESSVLADRLRENVPIIKEWDTQGRRHVRGRPWLVLVDESEEEHEEELERNYAFEQKMEEDLDESQAILLRGTNAACFWLSGRTDKQTLKTWEQRRRKKRGDIRKFLQPSRQQQQVFRDQQGVDTTVQDVVLGDLATGYAPEPESRDATEVVLMQSGSIVHAYVDVTAQSGIRTRGSGPDGRIYTVVKGSAVFTLNGKVHRAKTNDCLRAPPFNRFSIFGGPRARLHYSYSLDSDSASPEV